MTHGIPWKEIKARWESGETAYFIEQSLERRAGQKLVTRQGINRRAKSEGWTVKPAGEGLIQQAENLPLVQERGKGISPSSRTPELIAAIVEHVVSGSPEYLAAGACGVHPGSLSRWKAEDPQFAAMIDNARRQNLVKHVGNIDKASDRGDWKAAQLLLSKAPETKEYFRDEESKGGISIVLNVTRGDTVTIDGTKAVIDHDA